MLQFLKEKEQEVRDKEKGRKNAISFRGLAKKWRDLCGW
jgi:hypothetical protein